MRSTAYGSNNSGKAITIILCLLIIVAAIWAATSDSAGGYISEKIFKPLFSNTESLTTAPTVSNTPVTVPDNNVQASSNMVTTQIEYKAKTVYAIQIGAFSSYENAKSGAKDAVVYGGAGYVITTGGFHKLYTSAFLNESEAQSYKTSLIAEGVDACISRIEIDGVQLDITASQDQIDVISSAHNTWLQSSEDLFDLVSRIEKNQVTTSQAKSELKDIHTAIQVSMTELSTYKDLSNVTEKLYENLELCDEQLSSFLTASLSDAEISSSIKYLMIDFIYRFGQYANDISV